MTSAQRAKITANVLSACRAESDDEQAAAVTTEIILATQGDDTLLTKFLPDYGAMQTVLKLLDQGLARMKKENSAALSILQEP